MANTQPDLSSAAEFAGFMRAYQDMVFSTAARLTGNDAQAEDIAQEVFLKAYEHFGRLSTSPAAGGWLKTVARNLTLNYLARHRHRWKLFSELRRKDADEDDDGDIDFPSPDGVVQALDARQRGALVDEALRALPEHQRVPLVLYHFENLPYEHIATTLDVSLAKVKSDIFRARAALAKRLMRQGFSRASLD